LLGAGTVATRGSAFGRCWQSRATATLNLAIALADHQRCEHRGDADYGDAAQQVAGIQQLDATGAKEQAREQLRAGRAHRPASCWAAHHSEIPRSRGSVPPARPGLPRAIPNRRAYPLSARLPMALSSSARQRASAPCALRRTAARPPCGCCRRPSPPLESAASMRRSCPLRTGLRAADHLRTSLHPHLPSEGECLYRQALDLKLDGHRREEPRVNL